MAWRLKIDDELYKDEAGSGKSLFITEDVDGITYIRWHALPNGTLVDMFIDDSDPLNPAVSLSLVGVNDYLLLETGDYLLLETGDKLLLE